jgi:hypothetical protein
MHSRPQGIGSRLAEMQMYQRHADLFNIIYSIKLWYNSWLDRLINLLSGGSQKEDKNSKPGSNPPRKQEDPDTGQSGKGKPKQKGLPPLTPSKKPK